jgi:GT2 family glycosyltransferase
MTVAAGADRAVAVIVPHYDDVERLDRCLAALTADPEAAGAEIVVADNGTDPAALAPLRAARPGVRFVVEPVRGAAAARNRGAAETAAPRLFFLDSDCVPAPGWLAAGRAALDRADLVGGAVTVFDETPPPRSGAEAFETVFAFDQKRYVEREGFSVSANLLTWRRVFDDVGGFAAGVSEDLDWCRRATAKGYRLIYAPEVRVAHPTRRDFAALARKFRRITAETHALGAGRPWWRLRWGLRAVAMALSPLGHMHRIVLSSRLDGAAERLGGVATLWRIRALRGAWMARQALGLPI